MWPAMLKGLSKGLSWALAARVMVTNKNISTLKFNCSLFLF